MSLLTVERSQSIERCLSSSSEEDAAEEEDGQFEERFDSPRHHPPKLSRMRSPSFAGYFASKGGAVSLPDGIKARTPTKSHRKPCAELQNHLQRMITLLREEDSLKMAVRIESQLPDKKRYLTAVANSNDRCILVGIDWASGPTIGLVLELSSTTVTKLDGDGGFHMTYESGRTYCFKPVSVQTLWSAMHVIERGMAVSSKNGHDKHYTDFINFYKKKIDSNPTSISEWNLMDDLMSTRQFDLVTSDQEDLEQAAVKKIIRAKLKEVMIKVDIDDVTSREIRRMCEDELGMDLSEFKSFLDQEIFTILGQMDSASKIFDYLYLGSEWNASDLEELQTLGIGYILNLTREIDNFFPDTFNYYNVRVWDEEDTELLQYWDRTNKFIHNAKMAGSKVLVHCRRGISRSASSVIAYVMKSRGWALKESMEYVKKCRSIVDPNAGFQKQLIIYEGILNSSRNRYSALFRQRSKSDVLHPALQERRENFKSSKYSQEIEEEDVENLNEDFERRGSNRPKSWTADSSGMDFDADVDPGKFVTKTSSKTAEMPPLIEDIEDASLNTVKQIDLKKEEEKALEDGKPLGVSDRKADLKGKRRLLSRAKTLPVQAARHWEEMRQKEPKVDDSRPLTEAEETKQENLLEQALAASVMKTQLLQSLVKLQESRGTRDVLDSQFSVESIIKPSSLRKASSTRRLPFERTRSFSDDKSTSPSHSLRERAYTIANSRNFPSDDDEEDIFKGQDDKEQCKTGAGDASDEKMKALKSDDTATEKEKRNDDSSTSEKKTGKEKESYVIETSQFQTVKESAKRYEQQEKLRARRIRILRSPRRHTIGVAELWKKMNKEAVNSPRSRSSEGRVTSRNESPSPEIIAQGRKDRKESISSKNLLAVHGNLTCEMSEDSVSSVKGEVGGNQMSREDDLSVQKLVKKHSEMIRDRSPPGISDSQQKFFNSDVSLIGENLISTSALEKSKANDVISAVVDNNNEENNYQDVRNDACLSPTDIVQPGIVKRQSKLFSRSETDKILQDQYDDKVSDNSEMKKVMDKENVENPDGDGRKALKISRQGSVKKLLREIEGKCSSPAQRPQSLDLEKPDVQLDNEVELLMHSNDKISEGNKQNKRGMLFCPESDVIGTKSAPVSPMWVRDGKSRPIRSSSFNSSRDVLSQNSNKLSSDTPVEDVRSLVDRFEIGDLA